MVPNFKKAQSVQPDFFSTPSTINPDFIEKIRQVLVEKRTEIKERPQYFGMSLDEKTLIDWVKE